MMIGAPCPVCRRAGGAITVTFAGQSSPPAHLCSPECARIFMTRPADLDFNEKAAVAKGGEAAGAYLEQIGITDLARLSETQWETFCQTLFSATCADLQRQADDEIPF